MDKIFLIPGMGADTRMYNKIDIPAVYDVVPIDWVAPVRHDTLATYAQKLIKQYNISVNAILIGTSLGGIIAVEIAKLVLVKKVILISSIKTIDEAPGYFRLFKTIPVYKLIPGSAINPLVRTFKAIFGRFKGDDGWLFNDMMKNSSPVFIKWAMGAVLQWNNKIVPPNIYQINGNKDNIFPISNIKDAQVVNGGTHIMILDKAKEINRLLKAILRKK